MPSFGTGSDQYTIRTTLEYLRRVREALDFHRQCVDRLIRLEDRYRKLASRKHNENSLKNQ